MGIDDILTDKRAEIVRLVTQHGASNVRVFGSVARAEATPESDVDLLVDGLENCAWGGGALLIALQTLIGRRVDLVSLEDLHWTLRERVLRESISL